MGDAVLVHGKPGGCVGSVDTDSDNVGRTTTGSGFVLGSTTGRGGNMAGSVLAPSPLGGLCSPIIGGLCNDTQRQATRCTLCM